MVPEQDSGPVVASQGQVSRSCRHWSKDDATPIAKLQSSTVVMSSARQSVSGTVLPQRVSAAQNASMKSLHPSRATSRSAMSEKSQPVGGDVHDASANCAAHIAATVWESQAIVAASSRHPVSSPPQRPTKSQSAALQSAHPPEAPPAPPSSVLPPQPTAVTNKSTSKRAARDGIRLSCFVRESMSGTVDLRCLLQRLAMRCRFRAPFHRSGRRCCQFVCSSD